MGVAPLEGLTRIAPLDTGAEGRRRLALSGIRGNLVTFFETFRLALDALRAHKLRSFLTLLGVILAVLTLVTVMSVVAGLNFYVADRVANLGANVYVVDRFGIITSEDEWVKAQKRPLLTLEEFEWVRDNMKLASRVAATGWVTIDIRAGNTLLENTRVKAPRPTTPSSATSASPPAATSPKRTTCIIHRSVSSAPTSRRSFSRPWIRSEKQFAPARTRTKSSAWPQSIGSAFGQSQDNFMLIPLVTYYKEWHTQHDWLAIFVQAQNAEMMSASEDEARMLMRAVRHLDYNAKDNFAILGSDSIMALWKQLTGNLFGVAVALTAVFLVVGGIVIMNIMLASVTERTREIGLRRSLGARKNHIILQFMTESAVLAAIGGIIGVLLAYAIVALGRAATSIPMKTPMSAVILSLSVSTGVGLFFGIYPAMRAAKLDPIEALRSD